MFIFREMLRAVEIGEIVQRYLPDKKNQKNRISPASQTLATIRIAPKICRSEPPTIYSECSMFHQNRFTFGGVITERVNTAKLSYKVNPIFGRSLLGFEPNNYASTTNAAYIFVGSVPTQ